MQFVGILLPTFVLVALIYLVLITLAAKRFAHIKRNPPRGEDFATGAAAMRYFEPVEMPANNFRNLFEVPVLYFALVPLLMITHHANHLQVLLAWIFVVLRMVHSLIHVLTRKVPPRFMVYMASCIVLAIMWVGFAIDILSAPGY